jgi:RIO-like serine/threonine protein kinase
VLGKGPLSPFLVTHTLMQILDVLTYLSKAFSTRGKDISLVHTDLSLHNIIISKNLNIKVVDYETSQLYEENSNIYILYDSNQISLEVRTKYG